MAVETAADRAAFFDADEWGEAATYTPQGGAPAAVTVIRLRPGFRGDRPGGEVQLRANQALVNRDELAADPQGGGVDTLTIDGTTWEVRNAEADTTGKVWKLDLGRISP